MRIVRYVIILLLIGGIAATPWAVGYNYRILYTSLIETANTRSPVKVELVNYDQGWLSSDAELRIDLNAPDQKKPDPHLILTVNQHITHGPLLKDPANADQWVMGEALVQSHFHLVKNLESKLLGANATTGILQIDSLVSFTGHYQSQIMMPQVTVKDLDGSKLTWQGLSGALEANVNGDQLQQLKSDITSGAIAVQNQTGNFSIPSWKSQGERHCEQTGLCSGSSELSLPSIEGIYNNTNVKLAGADVKAAYGMGANNAYSMNMNVVLNLLTMPDYTVGPVSIKLALNNLNATAMEKLVQISRGVAGAQDQDKETQRMLLLAQYNSELPHLMTTTTTLTQEASINTSYGNFTSSAKVFWPANTPLPANSQDMSRINFKVNMRAATKLVDQLVSVLDAEFNSNAETAPTSAAPMAHVPPPVAKASPAEQFARQLLQPYVAAHKIKPDVITAVVDLQKQHLLKSIYGISIDKIILIQTLPLPVVKKLAQQLKDNYAQNYVESDVATEIDTASPVMATADAASKVTLAPTPASTPTPTPTLKQELNSMLQKGMVIHDKDDYVVSMDYENGQMQINGKTIVIPTVSSQASTQ